MTPQILLTLRTSDGCVGQRFLHGAAAMAWDIDPNGDTVQAIFSLVDGEALRVLEVAEIDGDQWRALEENDAYEDWVTEFQAWVNERGSLAAFVNTTSEKADERTRLLHTAEAMRSHYQTVARPQSSN